MAKLFTFLFGLLFFTFSSAGVSLAQSPLLDSSINVSAQKANAFFNKEIKSQSRLYNGTAYLTYGSNVQGYATFQDQSLVNGSIVYDGIRYDNVPLLYDLYLDKVVTAAYGNNAMISLIKEKVSDFYLNQHHFIYLNPVNDSRGLQMPNGFFDLLYDGKFKVLLKRVKKLQFSTNVDAPYYFTSKTNYFLERNGEYEEFSSESSFLNLFKDKKNEMKKYLSDNKIRFKDNPEKAIVILAKYYDQL